MLNRKTEARRRAILLAREGNEADQGLLISLYDHYVSSKEIGLLHDGRQWSASAKARAHGHTIIRRARETLARPAPPAPFTTRMKVAAMDAWKTVGACDATLNPYGKSNPLGIPASSAFSSYGYNPLCIPVSGRRIERAYLEQHDPGLAVPASNLLNSYASRAILGDIETITAWKIAIPHDYHTVKRARFRADFVSAPLAITPTIIIDGVQIYRVFGYVFGKEGRIVEGRRLRDANIDGASVCFCAWGAAASTDLPNPIVRVATTEALALRRAKQDIIKYVKQEL